MSAPITKTYESSSSSATYVCTFYPESGSAVCDAECPGYRFSKTTPKSCKHTKDLTKLVAAGYVGEGGTGQQVPAPPIVVPESDGARQKPMLASALDDRFIDPVTCKVRWAELERTYGGDGPSAWLLEEKIDGHRLLFRHRGGKITAWSRPTSARGSKDRPLPKHLVDALQEMPEGVYDGELFVPGGTSSDVTRREMQPHLRIALFDIVEIMGAIVTDQTWLDRRAMLDLSVSHHVNQHDATDVVVFVLQTVPVTQAAVEAIWERGGEGAIIKRPGGYYKQGWRSTDWLKVKRGGKIDMVITGFEAGEFGPYSKVLLRGEDGLTSSVKTKDTAWRERFAKDPDRYVGKVLVVKFTERTPPSAKFPQGSLRHPMFDHVKGEGE